MIQIDDTENEELDKIMSHLQLFSFPICLPPMPNQTKYYLLHMSSHHLPILVIKLGTIY